jgi:hypothetical protein
MLNIGAWGGHHQRQLGACLLWGGKHDAILLCFCNYAQLFVFGIRCLDVSVTYITLKFPGQSLRHRHQVCALLCNRFSLWYVAACSKFWNKCPWYIRVLSDRRGGSSASNTRKDEYNWRYDADDISEEVLRASAALESVQLGGYQLINRASVIMCVQCYFFCPRTPCDERMVCHCRHSGDGAEWQATRLWSWLLDWHCIV